VLDELNDAGQPLSINELAQRTMTDRSSVADVVERLVQNGYATRERSVDDRRRAEVRITPSGKALAQSAPPAPGIRLANGLRRLSQEELKSLLLGMSGLLARMGLADGQAGFMFEDDKATASEGRTG
jgi:DNA-binding MarR family transcriptional regulator